MRAIQIVAASRLHFGLLSPGAGQGRRFGGIGVMVEEPSLRISAENAERFSATGPGADRVHEFAERWSQSRQQPVLPGVHLTVHSLPRMHSGLGVGTQLALSVARLLAELAGESEPSPVELATAVGRGLRSAVGTYGFVYGGLISESGKAEGEPIAPLESRVELPAEWTWVLACPREGDGLHGSRERDAFAALPEAASHITQRLTHEVQKKLLPAAANGDFETFSSSLYSFGHQSGLYFAAVQGGAYNGPRLQHIVDTIRSLGVTGVGQSSWGPTIFALCPNPAAAQVLVDQLSARVSDAEIMVTSTANHGAKLSSRGFDSNFDF